jgi:hypothetical protein
MNPVPLCRSLALTAAIAVAAAAPASAEAWPTSPAGAADPWRPSPYGAHAMIYVDQRGSVQDALMASAASAGVSRVRVDVALSTVAATNPFTPGAAPDFSGVDRIFAFARRHNVRLVVNLWTTPAWAVSEPCRLTAPPEYLYRCPPSVGGSWFYGDYARRIAERGADVVDAWEVWNEPNTAGTDPATGRPTGFFFGNAAEYARLLDVVSRSVRVADPDAHILIGGLAWEQRDPGFLDWVMQTPTLNPTDGDRTLADVIDAGNVHLRGSLDWSRRQLAIWRKRFARYGVTAPIWVTEHGYPSATSDQEDPAYRGGPAAQAAYLALSVPTLLHDGAGTVFVTWRDNLGGTFASEGVVGGATSDAALAAGQLRAEPKPAYSVLRALARG